MSGEKSSTISYDRRGEIILNIRSIKEDLLRKVRFLKNQIEDLQIRIEKEKVSIKNKNLLDALNNCLNILNSRTEEIDRKEKLLDSFPIITGATISGLEKDQRTLIKESDHINKIINELNYNSLKVSEILEIDDLVFKVNSDFAEVEDLIRNNSSLMQEWSPKEYEELIRESRVHKERFNKYIVSISSNKTDSVNLSDIKGIYKELQNHINKVENMITNYTIKDNEIKTLKNRMEKLRLDINELAISTKDSVLKGILTEYLNRLKISEAELEKKRYEGMNERFDAISDNLPLLKKVDAVNYVIETEMSKIEAIVKEHDAILRKWVMKDYEDYLKDKDDIYIKLGEYKKGLQSGGVIDVTKLTNLLEQTRNLSDKIDSSLSTATGMEKLHQKRLYVIKSLREVCESLGFDEINEPHYEKERDTYSPMIQDFDTLIYGTLTFKVTLEGKVASSSGMSIDDCEEKYSEISERLKEQYGIESEFKIVGEEEPLRKTRTAKDLPKTSATKYKSKGGS